MTLCGVSHKSAPDPNEDPKAEPAASMLGALSRFGVEPLLVEAGLHTGDCKQVGADNRSDLVEIDVS